MTLFLSAGYFDGSDAGFPYSWNDPTAWFANGISTAGYPSAGDTAQISVGPDSFGYIVGVDDAETTGALQFVFNSGSLPADYVQDAVLQVVGPGSLTLTGAVVGTTVQSIAGNAQNDGYVNISQGGTLEVDSLASAQATVFSGDYSNGYDFSPPAIDDNDSQNDELLIGATGGTGYNYTNGSFSSPIYGLIGGDTIVFGQIAYNPSDTFTFTPGTASMLSGTIAELQQTYGTPGTLSILDATGTTIASLTITAPTDTGTFRLVDVNGDLAVTDACFLSGTRILTERGEVAVEDLRERRWRDHPRWREDGGSPDPLDRPSADRPRGAS